MKQIMEDYVPFEIAKLLKEKGFDEFTFSNYSENGIVQFNEVETRVAEGYQRPTHQMALKWLREVHNWYIDIRFNRYYQYYIPIVYNMSGTLESIANLEERPKQYEQAVEAALLYVLKNLI